MDLRNRMTDDFIIAGQTFVFVSPIMTNVNFCDMNFDTRAIEVNNFNRRQHNFKIRAASTSLNAKF